jgi:hypothetical protein
METTREGETSMSNACLDRSRRERERQGQRRLTHWRKSIRSKKEEERAEKKGRTIRTTFSVERDEEGDRELTSFSTAAEAACLSEKEMNAKPVMVLAVCQERNR